jgi:hypothetical protein
MIKVMHLEMFCFDYSPVFSEDEKVLYRNGQIVVSYNGNEKILGSSDITEIKLDTLYDKRLQQNWNTQDIMKSLDALVSDNQSEKEKYKLLYCEQEDEKDVSFEFMLETLKKLNYKEISFDYIAYGK